MRIDNPQDFVFGEAADERAAYNGDCYIAANQAALALGTALTATMVTLALVNPLSSQKRVKVLRAGVSLGSAPAGAALYVLGMVGPPAVDPITNTLAPGFRRTNGSDGIGDAFAYTVATLGAVPEVIDTIGSIPVTGFVGATDFARTYQTLILQPGSSVTIQGLTTASTGICSFLWREMD